MNNELDVWNEMLEIVARPVRAQPGVDRTLREILDAVDSDAAPEETRARVREFLQANRARLTTDQMDDLIAYGMCASNAVKAMVPHIGAVAAWERGIGTEATRRKKEHSENSADGGRSGAYAIDTDAIRLSQQQWRDMNGGSVRGWMKKALQEFDPLTERAIRKRLKSSQVTVSQQK